jgi:hypothetical protein
MHILCEGGAFNCVKLTFLLGYFDWTRYINVKPVFAHSKAGFPLGGILRAQRKFSLSFLISSTREITRQRKIPLRTQNSA